MASGRAWRSGNGKSPESSPHPCFPLFPLQGLLFTWFVGPPARMWLPHSFCSSFPQRPTLRLWVSSPHALERESDWLTWSQMSSPGPISYGHGASSHRTKVAPQHTGPAAWVHCSRDAQNGQNVFKAHVTALQTGWKCRACPSDSVELSLVSGRLSSSRLPWKHGATPAHHWGLLSLECLPPGLIFVVLPPSS